MDQALVFHSDLSPQADTLKPQGGNELESALLACWVGDTRETTTVVLTIKTSHFLLDGGTSTRFGRLLGLAPAGLDTRLSVRFNLGGAQDFW